MLNGLYILIVDGTARVICPQHPDAFILHGRSSDARGLTQIFCKCARCDNSASWANERERNDNLRRFVARFHP